jgi:hypothetical protein
MGGGGGLAGTSPPAQAAGAQVASGYIRYLMTPFLLVIPVSLSPSPSFSVSR